MRPARQGLVTANAVRYYNASGIRLHRYRNNTNLLIILVIVCIHEAIYQNATVGSAYTMIACKAGAAPS